MNKGDLDSKTLLEELAPQLVTLLKKHKQWENPNHCLSTTKRLQESLSVIMEAVELHEAFTSLNVNTIDALIEYSLTGTDDTSEHDVIQESDTLDKTDTMTGISNDPGQAVISNDINDECQIDQASNDMNDNECHGDLANNGNHDADTDDVSHDEAICNLLIDSEVSLFNEKWDAKSAKSLIKALQPFCEMPSKDRRKRFAASQLYGDLEKPESHDVSLFEYWAIGTAKLQNACCFLLGKIIFMSHLGKSCTSEMKTNPNLNIMFNVYEYDSLSKCYSVNGRSGLNAKLQTLTMTFY